MKTCYVEWKGRFRNPKGNDVSSFASPAPPRHRAYILVPNLREYRWLVAILLSEQAFDLIRGHNKRNGYPTIRLSSKTILYEVNRLEEQRAAAVKYYHENYFDDMRRYEAI